jgi:hypothetical protein
MSTSSNPHKTMAAATTARRPFVRPWPASWGALVAERDDVFMVRQRSIPPPPHPVDVLPPEEDAAYMRIIIWPPYRVDFFRDMYSDTLRSRENRDWSTVQEQVRLLNERGDLVVQVWWTSGLVNIAVLDPRWDYEVIREEWFGANVRATLMIQRDPAPPRYLMVGIPLQYEEQLRRQVNLCKTQRLTADGPPVLQSFVDRDGDLMLHARVALYLFDLG